MPPSRIRPGLVSVTFRKLSPEQVIELAKSAGLEAIEWGGDIHVPHGDVAAARRVGQATRDAGLGVSAYGSYYRVGAGVPPEWSAVLDSASALEAKSIRVWAGTVGSAKADAAVRGRVRDDLVAIAEQAAARGMGVSMEYHNNTLTDTLGSTLRLLQEVGHPNLRSYWQPRHGIETVESVADIEALRPYLGDLHVFHWWPDGGTRLPLEQGAARWKPFLTAANDGRPRYALLEFVRGDDPAQFLEDAATLKAWLSA